MGFDMHMREPPTTAEVKAVGLDADDPGYFRYNIRAMPVMVTTMMLAGVVVDDDKPPAFPKIPETVTGARREAMGKALWDPKLEAKLPADDRAIVAKYRTAVTTHSAHAGKVPAYKFRVNDGFLVAPDECAAIAKALRSYRTDPAKLGQLKKVWHDAQAAAIKNLPPDERVLYGNEELDLGLDDWNKWISDWAAYNEVAAKHGGYTVD